MKLENKIKSIVTNQEKSELCSLADITPISELESIANEHDFRLFYLDGKNTSSETELFKLIAKAMMFPKYFGNNWDALRDCLQDLDWIDAEKYIIVIDNYHNFISETLIEILTETIEYWQQQDTIMYIFLRN